MGPEDGATTLRAMVDRAPIIRSLTVSDNLGDLAVIPAPPECNLPGVAHALYDIARKEYLMPDNRGRWLALSECQFRRRCRLRGISARTQEGCNYSPFDKFVTELQHNSGVDFVGPI